MLASLSTLLFILEAVFGIGLLIFAHEFGHFIIAKWRGVRVDVFSLGFGPRLFGFARGGTDYRVSAVPLGGYVKMAGETVAETRSGAPDELTSKPAWSRLLIFAAGPGMNLVVAVPLCVLTYVVGITHFAPEIGYIGPTCPEWNADLQVGDVIQSVNGERVATLDDYALAILLAGKDTPVEVAVRRDGQERHVTVISQGTESSRPMGLAENVVQAVQPKSAAEEAGLKPGDRIVAVDGRPIRNFYEFRAAVIGRPEQRLELTVVREGEKAELKVPLVPKKQTAYDLGLDDALPAIVGRVDARGSGWRPGQEPQMQDRIVRVKGPTTTEVVTRQDLRNALAGSLGQPVTLGLRRGDREVEVPALAVTGLDGRPGLELRFLPATELVRVAPSSPLGRAGLHAGDRITKVGGNPLKCLEQLEEVDPTGAELNVEYERNGQLQSATVKPGEMVLGFVGVSPRYRRVLRQYPVGQAVVEGARETWKLVGLTLTTLAKLVTHQVPASGLSGPVQIFKISYEAAVQGTSKLLWLLAFISVNLAIVNILPIPILDGGHILFLLIEKVKGKPVGENAFVIAQYAGLVLLLSLVVYVTYNDIWRLITKG